MEATSSHHPDLELGNHEPPIHQHPEAHEHQQHRSSVMTTSDEDDPISTIVTESAFAPSPTPERSSWRNLSSMQTLTLTCPRDSQQPLTVFAKLTIQPGYEQDFEQWYHDVTKLQHDHWPGYLSSELLRPIAHGNEYISIFRYDSYEHLEAWMTSSQRHAMLQRAKEFSNAPPQLSFHSLEYWFVPPQELQEEDQATVDGQPSSPEQAPSQTTSPPPQHVRPPAKYKMVLVTFLAIWAMNQWTTRVVLRIFGVGTLPQVWVKAFATFLTVLVAAYIALPVSTALLGFWLFPHQPYTTSLRNGFMSLPWPVPQFMTYVESSFKTKESSATSDKPDRSQSERNASVVTAKTDLEHAEHDQSRRTLEVADDVV